MTTTDKEREKLKLRGRYSVPITKDHFPIGVPVRVEAIIDSQSGWEFDAPMHIMRPFHRSAEVGSIGVQTLEGKIEDILIDLDCGRVFPADVEAWPYTGSYLKRIFSQVQAGKRLDRFFYMVSTVTVKAWGDGDTCVDYDIETVEMSCGGE